MNSDEEWVRICDFVEEEILPSCHPASTSTVHNGELNNNAQQTIHQQPQPQSHYPLNQQGRNQQNGGQAITHPPQRDTMDIVTPAPNQTAHFRAPQRAAPMHRSSMYSFQGQTARPINQTPKQWNTITATFGSATLQPGPTPSNYVQPEPKPPSSSVQQLVTAGALENYKRKVQQLEQENLELRKNRASATPPAKPSVDEATVKALKRDLNVARNAQRKAEQRAELAELELASREEKAEFVDATQPMPMLSQPQPSQSRQPFTMSRCGPSRPKRRRSNSHTESQSTKRTPVRQRAKPRVNHEEEEEEEVPDDADWAVPNAAWLEEYDSSSRKAERVRAAVFTDARTQALVALGARNPPLKKAMGAALAHASEALWTQLRNALVTARGGSQVVLETLRALQLSTGTYDGASAELAASALKRDEENDACLSLLASAEGGNIIAKDPGLAKIIHDATLNGASDAVAVTAATARVSGGEIVDRLAVAALDGARLAESRYILDTLAIAERNPSSGFAAELLLALLEDNHVGLRVARLVTDVGAMEVDRAVLVRAMLVLMDKMRDVDEGQSGVWRAAFLKLVAAWVEQLRT